MKKSFLLLFFFITTYTSIGQRQLIDIDLTSPANLPYSNSQFTLAGLAMTAIEKGELSAYAIDYDLNVMNKLSLEEYISTTQFVEYYEDLADPDDPYSDFITVEETIRFTPFDIVRMEIDCTNCNKKGNPGIINFLHFYAFDYQMGNEIRLFSVKFDEFEKIIDKKKALYLGNKNPFILTGSLPNTYGLFMEDIYSVNAKNGTISTEGEFISDFYSRLLFKLAGSPSELYVSQDERASKIEFDPSVVNDQAIITSISDALKRGYYQPSSEPRVLQTELPESSKSKNWIPKKKSKLQTTITYEVDLELSKNSGLHQPKRELTKLLLDEVLKGNLKFYQNDSLNQFLATDEIIDILTPEELKDEYYMEYDSWEEFEREEYVFSIDDLYYGVFIVSNLRIGYESIYSMKGEPLDQAPKFLGLVIPAKHNEFIQVDKIIGYLNYEEVYDLMSDDRRFFFINKETNQIDHYLNAIQRNSFDASILFNSRIEINYGTIQKKSDISTNHSYVRRTSTLVQIDQDERFSALLNADKSQMSDLNDQLNLLPLTPDEEINERMYRYPDFTGADISDIMGGELIIYEGAVYERKEDYDPFASYFYPEDWWKLEISPTYSLRECDLLEIVFEHTIGPNANWISSKVVAIGYGMTEENYMNFHNIIFGYIDTKFITDQQAQSIISILESGEIPLEGLTRESYTLIPID